MNLTEHLSKNDCKNINNILTFLFEEHFKNFYLFNIKSIFDNQRFFVNENSDKNKINKYNINCLIKLNSYTKNKIYNFFNVILDDFYNINNDIYFYNLMKTYVDYTLRNFFIRMDYHYINLFNLQEGFILKRNNIMNIFDDNFFLRLNNFFRNHLNDQINNYN